MALLTKTVAQFVTAVESGSMLDILAALKKPGADRVVMVVKLLNSTQDTYGLEVWDVG